MAEGKWCFDFFIKKILDLVLPFNGDEREEFEEHDMNKKIDQNGNMS